MFEYILSPEFVQLVEEHPDYFFALAIFAVFACFFVLLGLSICIHAIPRPSRATYHYHWPAQDTGASESSKEKEKPWEAYGAERWAESTLKPMPDASHFRKYSRVPIPKDVRFRILRRDKFRCQLCGSNPSEASLHVDHRMPVAAGGTNDEANLWTLCSTCNLAKSDKIMEELFDDFLNRGQAKKGGSSLGPDTNMPSSNHELMPVNEEYDAELDDIPNEEDELIQ